MNNLKIPKRIQGYIKDQDLKQLGVAKRAGYTAKQFSAMMTGRKKITVEDMERICFALNVSPLEFIKPESQKVG